MDCEKEIKMINTLSPYLGCVLLATFCIVMWHLADHDDKKPRKPKKKNNSK